MHDAAELFDPRPEPSKFLFANLVMLRIAGLGVSFLQFLEHGSFAVRPLRPDAEEAAVHAFSERSQEGNIVVIRRIICQRSEEHTSELQSLMRISYAVFCLKTKKKRKKDAESH